MNQTTLNFVESIILYIAVQILTGKGHLVGVFGPFYAITSYIVSICITGHS